MGFLDAAIDSSFKRTSNHWEFFPYTIGVGYHIASEERYREIREAVKRHSLRFLVTSFITGLVAGVIALALCPGLICCYLASMRSLARGLPRADQNLTADESLRVPVAHFTGLNG